MPAVRSARSCRSSSSGRWAGWPPSASPCSPAPGAGTACARTKRRRFSCGRRSVPCSPSSYARSLPSEASSARCGRAGGGSRARSPCAPPSATWAPGWWAALCSGSRCSPRASSGSTGWAKCRSTARALRGAAKLARAQRPRSEGRQAGTRQDAAPGARDTRRTRERPPAHQHVRARGGCAAAAADVAPAAGGEARER